MWAESLQAGEACLKVDQFLQDLDVEPKLCKANAVDN